MGAGTWESHQALLFRHAGCVNQAVDDMSEHFSFDLSKGNLRFDDVVPPGA
jgi:hypothetical protein